MRLNKAQNPSICLQEDVGTLVSNEACMATKCNGQHTVKVKHLRNMTHEHGTNEEVTLLRRHMQKAYKPSRGKILELLTVAQL